MLSKATQIVTAALGYDKESNCLHPIYLSNIWRFSIDKSKFDTI